MEKKLKKIGFIGLGTIGAPMSRALLRAGFDVTVCDKYLNALKPFIADGVKTTQKPSDLAGSEIIIVMVATDEQVKEVFSGEEGFLEAVILPSPPLVAVMSTIMPQTTLELGTECAARNVRLVDATVSGLPPLAEKGELTIMVGGEEADLEAARPVFEALGKNIFHCGPLGTGDTTKLVNNIIGVTNLYLTVEAMAVGIKLGMDPHKLAEIMEQSSGRNMSTRDWENGKAIFDLFSQSTDMAKVMVDLSRKDLSHAQELARSINIDVPLLDHIIKAIDNFDYKEIKERWKSVV